MLLSLIFVVVVTAVLGGVEAYYQEEPCASKGGHCFPETCCRGGTFNVGECPSQPESIRCCYSSNACGWYQEPTCDSLSGECMSTACCEGSNYVSDKCPTQPIDIKCCLSSYSNTTCPDHHCNGITETGRSISFPLDPTSFETMNIRLYVNRKHKRCDVPWTEFNTNNQGLTKCVDSGHLDNAATQTIYVVHGWNADPTSKWSNNLVEALQDAEDAQVIVLDWTDGAFLWRWGLTIDIYKQAASNTVAVGEFLANVSDWVEAAFPGKRQYCMGHSLGAHVCGQAGRRRLTRIFDRVTGFDPASPCFESPTSVDFQCVGSSKQDKANMRIGNDTGTFVDIIHTTDFLGLRMDVGHVDFYINEASGRQPGCPITIRSPSCGHSRPMDLYIESITPSGQERCVALESCTRSDDMPAHCTEMTTPGSEVRFGYAVSDTSEGIYHVRTGDRCPYCKGTRSDVGFCLVDCPNKKIYKAPGSSPTSGTLKKAAIVDTVARQSARAGVCGADCGQCCINSDGAWVSDGSSACPSGSTLQPCCMSTRDDLCPLKQYRYEGTYFIDSHSGDTIPLAVVHQDFVSIMDSVNTMAQTCRVRVSISQSFDWDETARRDFRVGNAIEFALQDDEVCISWNSTSGSVSTSPNVQCFFDSLALRTDLGLQAVTSSDFRPLGWYLYEKSAAEDAAFKDTCETIEEECEVEGPCVRQSGGGGSTL